jgi:uncharacterized protein (DUF1697 family)
MNLYIALLRGINVSGQKLIVMAELKTLLINNGFENVITYIQSGNIIFHHPENDDSKIAEIIHHLILQKFGFDVMTLVYTKVKFEQCIHENPFLSDSSIDPKQLYFTFLESIPTFDRLEKLQQINVEPEKYFFKYPMIYIHCTNGYGNTKISNQFFEQQLKVRASTRNFNTVKKLLALAG